MINELTIKIGKRIKELRKTNKLSQEKFAELIGINVRQVSRIETGESFITSDTLINIFNAFNIEPFEFFNFELNKEHEPNNENFLILKDKIKSIKDNEPLLEYMIMAIDAVNDKQSLQRLKDMIHGLELIKTQVS